ncbi:hypothetical protein QKL33_gp3 [Torque teno mini virus SHA]|uniref:DUF755 domain-containing protein n=1 Tax=Torque teno mini virus SHA TaxID=2057931 RepID=A0A3S6Q7Y4_9VIRU|nr:hypothetical protein QKL33_gp3 [Torque teno mini virus SHA]AUD10249.1 hypothetical protein [Torque teno mini virus SHA]
MLRLTCNMNFYLSLEDAHHQWMKYATHSQDPHTPRPVTSYHQLYCRTQKHQSNTISAVLMKDGECSQQQLQNELRRTKTLQNLCLTLQDKLQQRSRSEPEKHHRTKHRRRKKTKRRYSWTSDTSEESKRSSESDSSNSSN